jgi:hypothetical protein
MLTKLGGACLNAWYFDVNGRVGFRLPHVRDCHGLDKLWKWNVVYIGMFVRNDGALMAVKKLYICLCAARDRDHLGAIMRGWRG